MALDGIVTRAIANDLQPIVGARIHKIYQPDAHDLIFQLRGSGMQDKLLLSANPTYPRAHLTRESFTNPKEAPMFCMLLRKYCEGGVIEAVEQIGCERILHLSIRRRDELGDVSLRKVVVELMGRHSNVILLDPESGIIHDGIHHVTPAISSYRVILPGSRYIAPPEQHKSDPLAILSESDFLAALKTANPEAPLAKQLVEAFSGFSPLLSKELVYRSDLAAAPAETAPEQMWPAFDQLMSAVRNGQYEPVIVQDADGKAYFSVTVLTHLNGDVQRHDTISQCLEVFYSDKAERDKVKQRASDLIRFLHNERNKNSKKLEKFTEMLEEAAGAGQYRVLGELLTAYMHQIKSGDKSVEVINYYEEPERTVVIPLDPQLSPASNAQRFFKRYTKLKNSHIYITEQIGIAEQEIRYLESLLQQLDSAALQDIEEIREELVEEGYLRARHRKGSKKKKKPTKPTLLVYTSSEGAAIVVGKNNTQNEYLTNRLAASTDTWLHTKDIPGSHVVIRGGDFGDATLEEAAMLAAHYSQARSSSLVPVDYTIVKHVRKPNGAKPGFVIYDHQKTLFVTPDEQRLKSLASAIKS
ncbi:fibronectin/fibrinogen-binding protein [Paenibacillaceae bacterium]|nr:fibronectin/fibrinogen-binding protein [Paenibacillaceae bacterium]